MSSKLFKYLILTLFVVLSLLIIWINLKLLLDQSSRSEKRRDIILQLNFLESELKINNLGQRMQEAFPEGHVFINALYGLAWCELAKAEASSDKALKYKAISEAIYAYNQIKSQEAKWSYDSFITPNYGVFYVGWSNYLLSKILAIDTTFENHRSYIDSFSVQCDIIKNSIDANQNPYLESYHGQSWPADMFVAMASVANYNRIFTPKYSLFIKKWLEKVKTKLDAETKMIPHRVDSKTGNSIQGARGSSMTLILRMLNEIDVNFGKQQFILYETNFASSTLGLPSIREYPKGIQGIGDIDSGPVIFGIGFAATIASLGTRAVYSKTHEAEYQYRTVNAFGIETHNSKRKSYLLGKLPIADAFIAWGRASGLKYDIESTDKISYFWCIRFQIISVCFILVLWLIYFRVLIKHLFLN